MAKTHLVVALAPAAIHARSSVYFVTIQDLVADLRKAWHENRFPARLALYTRPKLLCIDEVGSRALDRVEAHRFFRVVSARDETGRLALTSNKGLSEWGAGCGDPGWATAILGRLLHRWSPRGVLLAQAKQRAGTYGRPCDLHRLRPSRRRKKHYV